MASLSSNIIAIMSIQPPAFNCFEVIQILNMNNNGAYIPEDSSIFKTKVPYYVNYRVSSVKIPGLKLEAERFDPLRTHYPTKITDSTEVSISWIEDNELGVLNYHRAWFANFYNKEKDSWKTGIENKKKKIVLVYEDASKYKESTVGYPTKYEISLEGLIPLGTPDLDFDWAFSGGTIITLSYKVDTIKFGNKVYNSSAGFE